MWSCNSTWNLWTLLRCLLTVVCVVSVSCSKDQADDGDSTTARSVLVYLVAENSLSSFASSDINEMLQAKSQLEPGENLVLYVDDTDYPRFYVINSNTTAESFSRLKPVMSYSEEMDSASPETFSKVLEYFFSHYKAESYGLVMWSHGSGWVNYPGNQKTTASQVRKTICIDNGHNLTVDRGSRMEVVDMAKALEPYPKLEFVLFDACFMQGLEVAYELRNVSNYVIGSPAEIPGSGAPYQNILAPMFDTPFNPQSMVYNYYTYYGESSMAGVVLSSIKTDEFDGFVSVMQDLTSRYSFLDESLYSDKLNYYRYSWNQRYTSDGMSYPDYYDIQGIMLGVLSTEDYAVWKQAFDKLVPYKYASDGWYSIYGKTMPVNHEQCGGVSVFIPLEKYASDNFSDYYGKTAWGKELSWQ